ncbi:hypothetical protein MNB_SM-7-790 [hydrothermal vent metagenome]|uniref:Uncharacterized protein n=1 Tax=hydrothermal vent metagenome TaxID=652676 RepID=A0A1W1C4P3_9ZZZZ
MKIDWEEFKLYKKEMPHLKGDNFDKLLYFVRSFYNIKSTNMMYDLLCSDEISELMLKKREIDSAFKLEEYMRKRL